MPRRVARSMEAQPLGLGCFKARCHSIGSTLQAQSLATAWQLLTLQTHRHTHPCPALPLLRRSPTATLRRSRRLPTAAGAPDSSAAPELTGTWRTCDSIGKDRMHNEGSKKRAEMAGWGGMDGDVCCGGGQSPRAWRKNRGAHSHGMGHTDGGINTCETCWTVHA